MPRNEQRSDQVEHCGDDAHGEGSAEADFVFFVQWVFLDEPEDESHRAAKARKTSKPFA